MATGRERRTHQRWDLSIPLALFGKDQSDILGHVVNVSESGMLVLSVKHLHRSKPSRWWVQIPANDTDRRLLKLDATAVWSEEDDEIGTFSTGFHIGSTPDDLIEAAKHLTDDSNP